MLGRYRLLELIGSGGMGVVFRAHDERLARDVAIKLLNPGSIRSAIGRHRVHNEAMALSRLSHPNIETIFEFDSIEDCDFLVVELIPGASLDDLIARGPVPQTLAVSLTMQLLRGLIAAHEKGIIHRDLKPSNLKLTPDSFLKILDFGLAHSHDEERAQNLTTETHSTVFSGTLPYMSPEQLRGGALDPRNDLYAAGLILYQMCTGRLPFSETGALLIDATLNRRVPPPRKLNPKIDPRIEAIILKALEKDPKDRYQSAREMLRDLEAQGSPFVTPPGWQRALQLGLLSLVALGAVVIGIGERARVSEWVQRQLHPVPANKYLAVMPFHSVSNDDSAFDQGLTDAVASKLMELTSAQSVQVVSPQELRSEHVTDLSDARKKLGVNLAIEGTLQQLEGASRVSLDLVDANTHRLLRAANLSVKGADAFALQDQVIDKTLQMLEIEMHTRLDERWHGTTNPEAFALYTRGVGFLENERPEDIDTAGSQFEQALRIDPGFAAAYAKLGMTYLAKYRESRDAGWIDRTRDSCEKALSLDSQSVQGLVCLGTLHLRTGDSQQAASDFSLALEQDPANAEAVRGLATAYEKLGSITQAEQAYKKAVELRPRYAVEHERLGLFYAHQAKYEQAAEQYQSAIRLTPDDPRPWARLGGTYLYSGKYDKAIEALQHALSIRPTFESYSNLGLSYLALRRFPESIDALNQAVNLGPNEIQPYGNLGRAYYLYEPTRSSAREPLLKAISLAAKDLAVNPNDTDAHLLSSQFYAMLGRKDDALTHLNAALRLQPTDAEALYFAAIVHSDLGESKEATEWLFKAIQRRYSLAEIQSAPELDQVRNDPGIKQLISALNQK